MHGARDCGRLDVAMIMYCSTGGMGASCDLLPSFVERVHTWVREIDQIDHDIDNLDATLPL